MDKVLVDTSAWIEFFKKKEPIYGCVSSLMEEKKVCCLGIVLAELLQGGKSEKELAVLREFVHVFNFLDDTLASWQKAGELSNLLLRKGKTVGLSDCYIAVTAQTQKAAILTLDKHFEIIKSFLSITLYEVKKL